MLTMPHWVESSTVSTFLRLVYEIPIVISFDWWAWDEGRTMLKQKSFDFNPIDIPTKCKLITAVIRNDRFCDGALISAFESGLILKLLESVKEKLPQG